MLRLPIFPCQGVGKLPPGIFNWSSMSSPHEQIEVEIGAKEIQMANAKTGDGSR